MEAFEEEAARLNVKAIIITMILSAFGFLVALSWRDAIQKTIEIFIPPQENLLYTYFAAFSINVIAVIVTYILVKLQRISFSEKEKKIIGRIKGLKKK